MAEAAEGGLARTVNLWVQSVAFVCAGLWGVFVFWDQNVAAPARAPINLSTQLTLRPAGLGSQTPGGGQLLAVELEVTATNPSSRTVYILNNYWLATGVKVRPLASGGPQVEQWSRDATAAVQQHVPTPSGPHYTLADQQVVQWGSLFPDKVLGPNESVSRTYVFFVPEGAFDMLDVVSALPSISTDELAIEYRIDRATGVVSPTIFSTGQGEHRELPQDEISRYEAPPYFLQQAESRQQLSLWREAAPAQARR